MNIPFYITHRQEKYVGLVGLVVNQLILPRAIVDPVSQQEGVKIEVTNVVVWYNNVEGTLIPNEEMSAGTSEISRNHKFLCQDLDEVGLLLQGEDEDEEDDEPETPDEVEESEKLPTGNKPLETGSPPA